MVWSYLLQTYNLIKVDFTKLKLLLQRNKMAYGIQVLKA